MTMSRKQLAALGKEIHGDIDSAIAKVNLGHTYLQDGALETAALCLREAADLLDKAAEVKDKALVKLGAKTVQVPLDQIEVKAEN